MCNTVKLHRWLATPLQVLRPVASWPGNTDTIFSLAYDAPRNRIITGAKDSQVWASHELSLLGHRCLHGCTGALCTRAFR